MQVAKRPRLIAFVGNPNAGKTTLFNALTGSHQKVANYPGVTVERVSGWMTVGSEQVECIDVPGLYSTKPVSEDERVAAEAIFGTPDSPAPDALLCVVDASNLERNLYLFAQLAAAKIPTVVALTMVDRTAQSGVVIDHERLSDLLGVEVIAVIGHKETGVEQVKAALERLLENPRSPSLLIQIPLHLQASAQRLHVRLSRLGIDASYEQISNELQAPGSEFSSFLDAAPEIGEAFEEERLSLLEPVSTNEVSSKYAWAASVQQAVLQRTSGKRELSLTDKIDRILTHRVLGLAVFVGAMYLVFQSIYSFSQPFMTLITAIFDGLAGLLRPHLAGIPILQSLVCDGILGGVGAMLVFLPQILVLFFFIAVLEGSGYLARAAFLMDRLLGWCGLNGRAFIPLLSSFACAIPGIMSARVMPDSRSRLATILVAPLMSCSARLPIYLLLIGAFIEPHFGAFWSGFTLFAMHLLGLLVAIPVVLILNRTIIRGKRLPFLLELPPYQWPKWRDVWLSMYFRGKVFVTTAGTTITMMSVIIWALSYFPRSSNDAKYYESAYAVSHQGASPNQKSHYVDQQLLAHSFLGRMGKTIEPVFLPAGFDWRITTAILSAFPARETVLPSLGIVFNLGHNADEHSTDLRKALQTETWPDGRILLKPYTAVGLMVFFALCCQCVSTLATVKRETNSWKWPVFMFTYMTALAYIAAVAINLVGQRLVS